MTSLGVSGSSVGGERGKQASAGAWRSILWKEWRESSKWGAAGMLLVAGALVFTLYNNAESTGGHIGLQHESVMGLHMVGCCVVGLLLGVMSWAFDVTPDRWGLLLHRPTTRAQWWWGKVLVNLVVYAAAVLLPWFVAGWWCSVPGNVAGPWYPEMLWPGVVNAAGGGVFYFAGMLTVVRSARWWVSRAVWLLPAGVVALCAAVVPSLWWTLAIVAAGWVVLTHAGWAHFRAKADRPLSTAGQVSSSLGVFVGVVVVGGVLAGVLATLFWAEDYVADSDYERYGVMADGRIVVKTYGWLGEVHAVRDLEGVSVPNPASDDGAWRKENQSELWPEPMSFYFPRPEGHTGQSDWRRFKNRYEAVRPMDYSGGWYLDKQAGLFLEYDRKSRMHIGWMGPSGYLGIDSEKPRGYAGPVIRSSQHQNFEVYHTPHEVFSFRTDTRQKLVIDQAKDAEGYDLPVVAQFSHASAGGLWRFDLMIDGQMIRRTFDKIGPDATATEVFNQAYGQDPQQWSSVLVYPLEADAGWVGMYTQPWDWRSRSLGEPREHLVVRVSSTGEELERFTVPELYQWDSFDQADVFTQVAVFGGVPFVFFASMFVTQGLGVGWAFAMSDAQTLGFGFVSMVLIFVAVGLLFSGLCVVQARRAGVPGRQVAWWALVGFFGGLAGWLTMRCSYRWRELKVARGAFPAPEPNGTEVWA